MTAVRLLAQQWQRQGQGSARLVTAELPVSYDRSAQVLQELLHRERPDIAIAVGLAAGRTRISIERLAVNLQDATGADNDGVRASGDPVRPEAPVAAWSRLPVKRLAIELSEAGYPVELSMSAGTYVCNSVFFHLTQWAQARGTQAGFVHVPDAEAISPQTCAQALHRAVSLAVAGPEDLHLATGREH